VAHDWPASRCRHQVGTTRSQDKPPINVAAVRSIRCRKPGAVCRLWWRHLAVAAALVGFRSLPLAAQGDLLAPVEHPPALQWWHGVIAVGGLSVLMAMDEPAQRYLQSQRSSSSNRLANTLRYFGQIEVYAPVTASLVIAGLVTGEDEITRAGARLATTLAFTGATTSLAKLTLGRQRPEDNSESDSDEYLPFSGHEAMPSGHSAMAFAFATALADDIDRTWASLGLYTLATGVAWSRLNDNRHWLSDVAAGAALGITSAKLVNGRWRIFNLRPPSILLGPRYAGIAWQITF
jgi:membrane-associated phospholipid phosphatase